MKFRSLLVTAMLATAVIVGACQRAADTDSTANDEKGRPNIVFIMSDDHAVQAVGAYGHPIAELAPTPNIDRIAEQGMVFRNAFVTNSLCGPARATMLTGKYSHINGFTRNGDIFDGTQPTWPRTLKQAGYQTAMIGKWHLSPTPVGLDFDYWKIYNDQGEYYNPDFITPDGMKRHEGYSTDLVTDFTLDWLQNHRDPDKPFVLFMNHKAPHRNWMPALRHTQLYANTEFPVPETYFDDYDGRRAAAEQEMNIYRDMYEGHDLKMTTGVGETEWRYDPWKHIVGRLTDEQRAAWDAAYQARNDAMNAADFDDREMALWKYQRYLQEYLGTVAAVDESVGALLDYLDDSGLTENTIIVYTSDQGFYLGEHGWFDKRFMYEESLRTPLLIQWPGNISPGTESDAMVLNVDFAPTFLELAGIEIPDAIQGSSLLPLMTGDEPGEWRETVYYHYYEYPGFHMVKAHYGVRNDRFKLIHFYDDIDAWEFYDLDADPHEMHNLIDEPAYEKQVAEMRSELKRLRTQFAVEGSGS